MSAFIRILLICGVFPFVFFVHFTICVLTDLHLVFIYSGYFFDVHFPWFIVYLLSYFRCPCWLEMLWFCMITEHPYRERTREKCREFEGRSLFWQYSQEKQCGPGIRLITWISVHSSALMVVRFCFLFVFNFWGLFSQNWLQFLLPSLTLYFLTAVVGLTAGLQCSIPVMSYTFLKSLAVFILAP